MADFSDIIYDDTKSGHKIPKENYLIDGKFPIIDQGQNDIAGYTNDNNGIYTDVPAIIFGDHTRIIKYVDKPFFLGADGVKVLKSKDKDANYKYLYYALSNVRVPDTGYNRHFKWLKESKLIYPDYKIQESIVCVLDTLTDLINKRKQQLQKLDELVKARFVEMFGDPVINPYNWDKIPLGELAEIKIGPFGTLLHKEDYINNAHALVNPSHIIDGKILVNMELTVSDDKYNELSAYHLLVNDVVMGRRGEMGRCAVVMEKGLLCGTGSMIIRTKGRLKADYIQKIISFPSFKKNIEDMAVGQTMPNLNVPIVSGFMITCPPIEVQTLYYTFIERVDKSKSAVKKSLEKLELLKKALMQEYFG